MATQRVTQVVAEVLRQEANETRATQVVTEVLLQEANETRVTQVVVEIIRDDFIPTPDFEGWGSAL